jgi:copper chaperone
LSDFKGAQAVASKLALLPSASVSEEASSFKEVIQVEAEFHIEGMHCDSCATDIKETLEETAGVRKADVTFKRRTAIVNFDDDVVQQSTLIKKIQDLGYTATLSGEPQSGVGA